VPRKEEKEHHIFMQQLKAHESDEVAMARFRKETPHLV
jgi:hypothetical protein